MPKVFYNAIENKEIYDLSGNGVAPEGYQEITLLQDEAHYVEDGVLKKKSTLPTDEEISNKRIQKQLYDIDIKSIRALRDGGFKEPGLLWIDYYKQEATKLRSKLV